MMDKSLFEESYANYLFWRHRLMPIAKAVCDKTGDVCVRWDSGYFEVRLVAKKKDSDSHYAVVTMFYPMDIKMMHGEHFWWRLRDAARQLARGIEKKKANEEFRQSEFAKTRQCYNCRAMIGMLCVCPHCRASN